MGCSPRIKTTAILRQPTELSRTLFNIIHSTMVIQPLSKVKGVRCKKHAIIFVRLIRLSQLGQLPFVPSSDMPVSMELKPWLGCQPKLMV